jgi:hypothetical protein
MLGVKFGQSALARFANATRGPTGINDPGFSHHISSLIVALS